VTSLFIQLIFDSTLYITQLVHFPLHLITSSIFMIQHVPLYLMTSSSVDLI